MMKVSDEVESMDRRGFGITTKVALVLLSTNLVAVLVTGLLYYKHHQSQLLETIEKHLQSVAQQESQIVNHMLDKHHAHIRLLARQLQLNLSDFPDAELQELFQNSLFAQRQINLFKAALPETSEIALFNMDGTMLMTTDQQPNYDPLNSVVLGRLGQEKSVVMDIVKKESGQSILRLLTYLSNQSGQLGILATKTELSELAELVDRHIGLGYTEETMLLYDDGGNNAKPIVPLKFSSSPDDSPRINPFGERALPQQISRYVDYRGKDVFAIFQMMPDINWALVFKIDRQEALAIVDQQRNFLLISLLIAAILVLIIAIAFARSLTRPLTDLTQAALMIASGDLDRRIGWASRDELGMLASAFNSMADKLIRANEFLDMRVREKTRALAAANNRLTKANRDLERITLEDPLTGIANRRAFDREIWREWKRCSRNVSVLSLLMIDIDYFKRYNDSLGHQAGDDCLIQVANVLQRICQRDNDLVARFGGEEFAILLADTTLRDCEKIASRIVEAFAREKIPHPASSVSDYVTVSVGFGTHLPSYNLSTTQFIEAVDKALYQAKNQGRNRICCAKGLYQPATTTFHKPDYSGVD